METAICQAPTRALLNLRKAERRMKHSCYHHGKPVQSMITGIPWFKPGLCHLLAVILSLLKSFNLSESQPWKEYWAVYPTGVLHFPNSVYIHPNLCQSHVPFLTSTLTSVSSTFFISKRSLTTSPLSTGLCNSQGFQQFFAQCVLKAK